MNPGWIDPEVSAEHPGLRLWTDAVDGGPGRSPDDVRKRLAALSDAFGGRQAMTLRTKAVPQAYRVFFRQVGLDPDVTRIPVEALALERLKRGRFVPRDRVADALTVAIVETGVGVWALDAETLEGELGIRLAGEGERLGRGPEAYGLPAGRLVVADDGGPVAVLFDDVASSHGVGPATSRVALFAVQVAGVPMVAVDEALWIATEVLED